ERLRLRLARGVARLVLAHEGLAVVVAVELVVLAPRALLLLLLLIVVGVLLPELLLRGGDKAEVMFGVLIIIFRRDRIAGALRIARKLDVFFRNMRGGAPDLHVRSVRLVDPRQRILAFAVIVVTSPHTLLTVSHDIPVLLPFVRSQRMAPRSVHLTVHAGDSYGPRLKSPLCAVPCCCAHDP